MTRFSVLISLSCQLSPGRDVHFLIQSVRGRAWIFAFSARFSGDAETHPSSEHLDSAYPSECAVQWNKAFCALDLVRLVKILATSESSQHPEITPPWSREPEPGQDNGLEKPGLTSKQGLLLWQVYDQRSLIKVTSGSLPSPGGPYSISTFWPRIQVVEMTDCLWILAPSLVHLAFCNPRLLYLLSGNNTNFIRFFEFTFIKSFIEI